MSDRLVVQLDPCCMRILSQSLTKLSAIKRLTIEKTTCKTHNLKTKKWQVYQVNSYDPQLYYHFQQICIALEII